MWMPESVAIVTATANGDPIKRKNKYISTSG